MILRLLILILFAICSKQIFAQQIDLIESNEQKIKLKIYFDEIYDNYILGNVTEYIDESKSGQIIQPKIHRWFSIPPNSRVNIREINREEVKFQSEDLKINPYIYFSSDSAVGYTAAEHLDNNIKHSSTVGISNYFWKNGYYCVDLEFNPIRITPKLAFVKFLELEIIIQGGDENLFEKRSDNTNEKTLKKEISNYSTAKKYIRKQSLNFSNNWIKYGTSYLKIAIGSKGIYRISYNDLINLNSSLSTVNPTNIAIYNRGNQIPIYVYDELDNGFNENDYIEFFADKNIDRDYINIVERDSDYVNYLNRYTDTTYLWVSFTESNPLRINLQAQHNIISDTLKNGISKQHIEEDKRLYYYDVVNPRSQLPFWQEHKVWSWYPSYQFSSKRSLSLYLDKPVEGVPLKTTSRAIGSYSPSGTYEDVHTFSVSLNDNEGDTTKFDLYETVNFKSNFPYGHLNDGANNLQIQRINTGLSPEGFEFDWVDVEYLRPNSAQYSSSVFNNDSLHFLIPEGYNRDEIMVEGNDFSKDDVIIYKIFPTQKKHINYSKNSNSIHFSDTLTSGDEYYLTTEDKVKKPKFISYKVFDQKLHNNDANYILISSRFLEESAEEYAQFIEIEYDVTADVFYMEDIYNQFSFGYPEPEAIKEFLKYAWANWSSTTPTFVTLLGEANYDYKDIWPVKPLKEVKNLVPSYGFPVSDAWFVNWDEEQSGVQEMFIGRIPARTNEEVQNYLLKHKNYLSNPYTDFNKRFMFFSGGDPSNSSELSILKNSSEQAINVVQNSDINGDVSHFYKTSNPKTNFGPYSFEEYSMAIDSGALYISYVGHSGTQTWDNGIIDENQLTNVVGNYSIISDFGCSTGKFAEPDVTSFSELFVNTSEKGNAISYLGNSSWGYRSIAARVPSLFTQLILENDSISMGEIHYLLKQLNFQNGGGFTDGNKVFNYCNILVGDPIVKPKLPRLPNFNISNNSIRVLDKNINDSIDSTTIQIELKNSGKVSSDTVDVRIEDYLNNDLIYSTKLKVLNSFYRDTLKVKIPTKDLLGLHRVEVLLDVENDIEEIYENDNDASVTFNVFSGNVRELSSEPLYNKRKENFKVLNSTYLKDQKDVNLLIDNDRNFAKPQVYPVEFDSLYAIIDNPLSEDSLRYWWKFNSSDSTESGISSFINISSEDNWIFSDSLELIESNNISFSSGEWALTPTEKFLKVYSAGFEDGGSAIIEYNGKDYIGELVWGIATAILDPATLEPISTLVFRSGGENLGDSLASYIQSLEDGTVMVLAIGTEARNYILGRGEGTPARNAIKLLGSTKIDSVLYRESWCIIGVKGAEPGTVKEIYSPRLSGPAIIDTSIVSQNRNGWLTLPTIENSSAWESLNLEVENNENADFTIYPIGKNIDGKIDTLDNIIYNNSRISLAEINAETYPNLKFKIEIENRDETQKPSLQSASVRYATLPELAINYQVVSIDQDTVKQGEDVNLSFYVYNVGETVADSFSVAVDVLNSDNSKVRIFEELVDSLGSEQRRKFSIPYNTLEFNGQRTFSINIDSNNDVRELFEDNNFFNISFNVLSDTTTPTMNLTIDGRDIFDGEYISSQPEIKVDLSDPSLIPITDTSSINIFLNNSYVSYLNNSDALSVNFSESNPKVSVNYKPTLEDGEYTLRVFGKDASENPSSETGITKRFIVQNEPRLLNVYNYPNPFGEETYFTFKLTQIPEKVDIKVFTIAGRLIKNIRLTSSQLNYDLNKIYWDGNDDDGDQVGNGVYLYKVIMYADDKKSSVTQKLAIVR